MAARRLAALRFSRLMTCSSPSVAITRMPSLWATIEGSPSPRGTGCSGGEVQRRCRTDAVEMQRRCGGNHSRCSEDRWRCSGGRTRAQLDGLRPGPPVIGRPQLAAGQRLPRRARQRRGGGRALSREPLGEHEACLGEEARSRSGARYAWCAGEMGGGGDGGDRDGDRASHSAPPVAAVAPVCSRPPMARPPPTRCSSLTSPTSGPKAIARCHERKAQGRKIHPWGSRRRSRELVRGRGAFVTEVCGDLGRLHLAQREGGLVEFGARDLRGDVIADSPEEEAAKGRGIGPRRAQAAGAVGPGNGLRGGKWRALAPGWGW